MIKTSRILGILFLVIGVACFAGELSTMPRAYEFIHEKDMYESLAEARIGLVFDALKTLNLFMLISLIFFQLEITLKIRKL